MEPVIGDTVYVRSYMAGALYEDTGQVTDMWRGVMTVNGHQYRLDGSHIEYLEIIPPADAVCRYCGQAGVQLSPVRVTQNYGEDGEQDDGGCFSDTLTEWRCADRTVCRAHRRELARLSVSVAAMQDAAAREDGWGAIGGMVGR